jgi:hypothetical protein
LDFVRPGNGGRVEAPSARPLLPAPLDNLMSLEFLLENFDVVLKTWAIFIPLLVMLLWIAWKMRGIFKA